MVFNKALGGQDGLELLTLADADPEALVSNSNAASWVFLHVLQKGGEGPASVAMPRP